MPQSLSMQFSNCNEYFHAFQKCELEHPIGRYLDYCRKYRHQMISCCKKERELSRRENCTEAVKRRQMSRNIQNLQEEANKESSFQAI